MATCLTSELRTYYNERIAFWTATLIKAEENLAKILTESEGYDSLKFDSGEAMSWAKFQELQKAEKSVISAEGWISHYRNKLNGTGIVKLNLRRKW